MHLGVNLIVNSHSFLNPTFKKLCLEVIKEMRVVVLFSGGKDSVFATHWALSVGMDVVSLITFKIESNDSLVFHIPCVELAPLQAKALDLPITYVPGISQGEELSRLKDCLMELRKLHGIDAVVLGVLLSDYQRLAINEICSDLNLRVITPLWRKSQDKYMLELVDYGFKFIITSISVMGLPPDLLGKILTKEDVLRIIELAHKYKFNPAFEGGEAETLVVDAPFFKYRIRILDYDIVKEGLYSWSMVVKRVELERK